MGSPCTCLQHRVLAWVLGSWSLPSPLGMSSLVCSCHVVQPLMRSRSGSAGGAERAQEGGQGARFGS